MVYIFFSNTFCPIKSKNGVERHKCEEEKWEKKSDFLIIFFVKKKINDGTKYVRKKYVDHLYGSKFLSGQGALPQLSVSKNWTFYGLWKVNVWMHKKKFKK